MATKPGLTWNVKDSFVSYVESLDDGAAEALANKTLPFATLEVTQRAEEAGSCTRLELTAALTGRGHLLLGGQYPLGQPLSPLHVALPVSDA